jgi:AcrR family transcriptional regulator
VPKRVDHEERRRQIADALLRTAATRGLHATGMREVAAEAGVSLRLVQYYFGTKEELMLFAMQQLAAQFGTRAMAQISEIKQVQDPVSPRDVIAAILTQALPADDERRTFTVLYTAYFALSLTDPALAIGPLVKNSNAVADVVASQLRAAQAADDTAAGLDPDLEALSLLAMSAGLGTSVLGGQSSPGQAQAVIDYHLDRLFPAPRPALPRAVTSGSKMQTPCRPVSQQQRLREEPPAPTPARTVLQTSNGRHSRARLVPVPCGPPSHLVDAELSGHGGVHRVRTAAADVDIRPKDGDV